MTDRAIGVGWGSSANPSLRFSVRAHPEALGQGIIFGISKIGADSGSAEGSPRNRGWLGLRTIGGGSSCSAPPSTPPSCASRLPVYSCVVHAMRKNEFLLVPHATAFRERPSPASSYSFPPSLLPPPSRAAPVLSTTGARDLLVTLRVDPEAAKEALSGAQAHLSWVSWGIAWEKKRAGWQERCLRQFR